jgi:hypothetical protein
MGKRRSKRTANAKQVAPSHDPNETYAEYRSRVGPSPSVKLVVDALNKAGITFDPANENDAQWLYFLEVKYETYDPFVRNDGSIAPRSAWPRFLIQDKNSRLATECLLSKLGELLSAILLCEQEADRTDIPAMKLNVALRVREELYQLQTIWSRQPNYDHDHSRWIENFIDMIKALEWSADHALEMGVRAPHGKSNTLFEYTLFVRGLYDFWTAKKSQIGVYQSGGRWTGPFVELVERCEELLPAELRPPSAEARGKRVARAIGAHKKAKAS